ncbi:hypothetical protein D3C71_1710300 [compost metagenome]
MYQLMTQYMSGLVVQLHDWHDYPVFKGFGYPACTNSDLTTKCGCGLEIRVVIVQNDRVFL